MKSHVGLQQNICLVTGKTFNVGILLDRRLKDSLEEENITGWGFSPEVQEKLDEGYVALVGVDYEKSTITDGKLLPENAYRTGQVAYVKKLVLNNILPDFKVDTVGFVPESIFAQLEELQKQSK